FGRRHSLRERRPRGFATGARPPVLLKTLGCRSQGDRRSRKPRGAVCGVAAPLRCTVASPSSRLLASDPTALATPPHTLFQQPARRAPAVEAPSSDRRWGRVRGLPPAAMATSRP